MERLISSIIPWGGGKGNCRRIVRIVVLEDRSPYRYALDLRGIEIFGLDLLAARRRELDGSPCGLSQPSHLNIRVHTGYMLAGYVQVHGRAVRVYALALVYMERVWTGYRLASVLRGSNWSPPCRLHRTRVPRARRDELSVGVLAEVTERCNAYTVHSRRRV